jgi:hypothetical protein
MVAGYTPQQGYTDMQSKQLADADFTEPGQDTGEDHSAHVTGKTCARCGRPITAQEAARRRGESDWVHDICPATE